MKATHYALWGAHYGGVAGVVLLYALPSLGWHPYAFAAACVVATAAAFTRGIFHGVKYVTEKSRMLDLKEGGTS